MIFARAAVVLTFAASAFAYTVTQPSNSSGWNTSGPNTVKWSTVSTDASNITIVLDNQSETPQYSEVLATDIQGSLGSYTVNPPDGGWKSGTGFRVNLVKSESEETTIYAQSDDFTITESTSSTYSSGSSTATSSTASFSSTGSVSVTSSSSGSSSGSLSGSSASTSSGASASVASSASSGSHTATGSASSTSSSSAAAAGMGVQTGLLSLLALLGVALA
ncbi:uncharacterized protein LAESUDRAFT_719340 [Laetiporus sulphureus 93-53]|uniref:Yeast cell wall synthesis Kre9/Knh1-like N-terminal domain-containing protein n=1 Tax=Laetiporus sulphureus 93-53 TaxID=1314785 RepID=A0A165IG78_9APHY|nr:uncharacterized protein LAESUDRAFT_719340 [Laetiporus sulphureus 93-53]KZT13030.1 hypothetical protein LAESUDRAFT_719340 [Laetiporus sulphureus 93-53]